MRYRQSEGNHIVFIKHFSKGKLTLVFADDMIVARDDKHEKQILKEKFVA